MSKVYIIDDQYVKDNYPSLATYDNNDILSVIYDRQDTVLVADITEGLYDDLIEKLTNGDTLDEDYTKLLQLTQKYLLALTIVGVFSFYEKSKDENSREYNVSNMYGTVKYRQKRLKDFINETSFSTTGSDFDESSYNYSPIVYLR